MFSGKSTELLRKIKRYMLSNKKCLLLKFLADTRYACDKVVTHDMN